jgi:hypothetical protein
MSEHPLDPYLPQSIRARIEQAYYARVSEQGKLENLIQDPDFWHNAGAHPALFSDHGVVHVRDVAQRVLQVLKTINGILIPRRDESRMECFMVGYGVLVAYLHDIGMSDLSAFGRAMHPEFAAQAVFSADLEDVIETMWAENCGEVTKRLTNLADNGILKRDPKIIFREQLALSVCHSRSKVPITILDHPTALRSHIQFILSHDLQDQYDRRHVTEGERVATTRDEQPPQFLSLYYSDFTREAFDWLIDESLEARALVNDVTDTLRALRCADALRQRGTVQKTSGGYEVFVSQQTGKPVYALRSGDNKLYLLELSNALAAGESNIASSELNLEGDLRISFHRGAYANEEALRRSLDFTAFTIKEILGDIVDSFRREPTIDSLKSSDDIQILLESTDDNPRFVELIREQLLQFIPALDDRIQIVPSLQNVSELERTRYLEAKELDWNSERRREVLERVKHSGQKLTDFDLVEGFKHIRMIDLQPGETLIQAGTPSAFVYIPLGDGLKIIPLGGYESFSVAAWMPLGNTGVIRGSVRNADVKAVGDISLLVIPKEIYLRHWYAPFTLEELKSLFPNNIN